MELESLKDLFVEELKDIYNAENQLVKALPKMAKAANSPELKKAFETHLEETKGQIERLDQIFENLGEKSRGPKCKGMEGLIEEGKHIMEEDAEPEVTDAGLICAAQKVEHYEIAGYGCLKTWAETLDEKEIVKLLEKTLNEEKETDKKLTELAEETINIEAMAGVEEEE
jgi:ferritin-like metal-binding protein YciE